MMGVPVQEGAPIDHQQMVYVQYGGQSQPQVGQLEMVGQLVGTNPYATADPAAQQQLNMD